MRVAGISHILPSRAITNDDVIAALRCESGRHLPSGDVETLVAMTKSAFERAGTAIRYQLAETEKPYELCRAAGQAALEQAGLAPGDVDLIIYASIGRGFIEPATANVFQDLLGLRNATCFDVIDACASWLRAIEVANTYLAAGGRYRTAMIITGEFISRYAYRYGLQSVEEFEHWFPGVTVGEAATATVLVRDEADDFVCDFRTWGEKRALCLIPFENCADYLGMPTPNDSALVPLRFASFGGQILRFGSLKLVSHFREADDFNRRSYDMIFGHPASDGICATIGRRCGLDFGKFQFTHHLYGNTASSSVPLAMSTARDSGRLGDGSRVLILFASAGLSTVLMRFTWRT